MHPSSSSSSISQPQQAPSLPRAPTVHDEESKKNIRAVFDRFDFDGNGFIDAHELGTILRVLGENPTEQEVRHLIEQVDANKDGRVDFDEFLHLHQVFISQMGLTRVDTLESLIESFRILDANGDGYLSREELLAALCGEGEALTEAELEVWIKAADTDGDGRINYEEFCNVIVSYD